MKPYRALPVQCLLVLSLLGACGDDDNDGRPDAGEPERDAGPGGGDPADAGGEDPDTGPGGGDLPDGGHSPDAAGGDPDAGPGDDAGGEPARWYEDKTAVELAFSGALGDAFGAAFAGTPDGIIPPVRSKDPFVGSATYASGAAQSKTVPVELAVRGNSSLQECGFPKLKFAFDKRVEDSHDLFFDTKKVKIGTHCGEEEVVNGTIGRLRNEKAAWREEVVYQLARELGITIMQTRPAVISYTDTSATPAFESPLTRKAFLLEHVDELARRLGATALKDPVDCGEDTSLRPEAVAVLRVKFFHAMVGNWDWTLGPPETNGCGSIMNTEVLIYPNGGITLVPADFDLAAFVVGEVRNPDTNQTEAIEVGNATLAARAALETSLVGESTSAVAAMKTEYLAKKARLKAVIDASLMDAEAKADGKQLLDGFFTVLSEP